MNQETEKPNTFAQMEQQNSATPNVAQKEGPVNAPGEMSVDDFSDTAVKDRVKYVRPNLDGQDDVIEKFQVFTPDTTKEPVTSQSGNSKYWPVQMLLTYTSKNEDGVQNREYISGARCFQQQDGKPSDIQFWYNGGETQSCLLWENVAKAKGYQTIKNELTEVSAAAQLSPREFVAFLNSKPKVKIVGTQYKNYNAGPGAPKNITKNMPSFA